MKYTAADGNGQIAQDGINRNLFLCYPDDTEEMSTKCLQYFKGEFIIHVGELFSTGAMLAGLLVHVYHFKYVG